MWSFLAIALAIIVAIGAVYFRWRRGVLAEIAEGADIEWSYFHKKEPEFVKGIDEARFKEIYHKVNYPRFPDYALAASATFVLSLPVTFAVLSMLTFVGERMGWTPEPAEVANYLLIEDGAMRFISSAPPEAAVYYARDLAGFYYFFGVLISWVLIVLVFTRRYHARRPGYLRDEIIRARE